VAQLADTKGIHHGEAIVVCGLGNSVNSLGDPYRFRTIGVNDIERAFTPTYMFCMDAPKTFAPDRLHFIQNSRARYIFTDHDLGVTSSNVVRFPIRKRDAPYFDDPKVLYYTGRPITSPFIAICLAAHMGAKAIGLIGVDFTAGHFFAADGNHKLTNSLPGIDRRFYELGSALLERGVKVFNLSAESRIRAFPSLSPDEFFELQQSGQPHSWTRPASRIYFYSCAPAGEELATLTKLINTQTTCSCRLSAPESPDIVPGSMPYVEQSIADDSHVDLDCEIAPLPQKVLDKSDFEDVWHYQVMPLLFRPAAPRSNGHRRALSLGVIVSQERASRDELEQTVSSLSPALSISDEIVIVGSRGASYRLPEWLVGTASLRYIEQTPGESFVAARNRAAQSCSGDLLVFTDANVKAPAHWADPLIEAFQNPCAAAVGPAIADLYQPTCRTFGMNFCDSELNTIALPRRNDTPYPVPLLANTFLAIRRNVMEQMGGFDGRMRTCGADDLELCFRLWTSGHECHLAPQLAVSWMNPFAAGALRPEHYWRDLLHNLLRLATVHFSPERLGAFIECASAHPEYPAVAAAMLNGSLSERRYRVRSLRQYSDDWFFDRFIN
jgi:GT2 family glycosyltransferase